MKRAVICVSNPQVYIPQLKNEYSLMIINPESSPARIDYLLEKADWSLLITNTQEKYRNGNNYDDEYVLLYTSGTTGDSKFYSFSKQQIEIISKNNISAYNITENDRYASVMPLWHAHGQSFYWTMQYANCDIEYFPTKQLKYISKYSPTFTTAVPNILQFLKRFNFDNLRFVASAGASLSDDLYIKLKDIFQVPILEAFGMTESISHCFTNPLEGEQRIGTVGLPNGIDAYIDQHKHLHIKGPSIAIDGWLDTGDLAEQDQKGYYKILGRSTEQINVNGIKLNPVSLERQLLEYMPKIKECAIFGTDAVKCIYVGDAPADKIQQFLLNIGPHCKAKTIVQLDEMPLNNSGKVSRSFLNQLIN